MDVHDMRSHDADELNSVFAWYPNPLRFEPINGFQTVDLSLKLIELTDLIYHELYTESDFEVSLIRVDGNLISIVVPTDGIAEIEINDMSFQSTPAFGSIVGYFDGFRSQLTAGRCQRVFAVPCERLAQAIVAHTGKPASKPIRFLPEFRTDVAPGSIIRALAATYHQGTILSDIITRSPLLAANLRDALYEVILVNLPHSLSELYAEQPPRAASWQVKRARDFIETNAALPLTVESIAEACNISVRTLYATFRDQLGTTPKLYLRRVRMTGARSELTDPASRMTVAEIARKWGFLNMSLFAKQYRESYGELPLRSRKARRLPASVERQGAIGNRA